MKKPAIRNALTVPVVCLALLAITAAAPIPDGLTTPSGGTVLGFAPITVGTDLGLVPSTGSKVEACAVGADPCDAIRDAALEACRAALDALVDAVLGEGSWEDYESAKEMCDDQFAVWEKHCSPS